MLTQSKGKMFLTDERGLNQLDWYRSYYTFNFGKYQHAHKAPFSNLYVLNDDTLAAGKHISMKVEQDSDVILIPIFGTIRYKDGLGNKGFVEPGQLIVLDMPANTRIRIANPYENEPVNFLQLWIRTPRKTIYTHPKLSKFNLAHNKNLLVDVFDQAGSTGWMGQLDGRAEITYKPANPHNNVFAFVVVGIFEMPFGLLQPRDGMVLWDADALEMEALSNNAVILLIEIPED